MTGGPGVSRPSSACNLCLWVGRGNGVRQEMALICRFVCQVVVGDRVGLGPTGRGLGRWVGAPSSVSPLPV